MEVTELVFEKLKRCRCYLLAIDNSNNGEDNYDCVEGEKTLRILINARI